MAQQKYLNPADQQEYKHMVTGVPVAGSQTGETETRYTNDAQEAINLKNIAEVAQTASKIDNINWSKGG